VVTVIVVVVQTGVVVVGVVVVDVVVVGVVVVDVVEVVPREAPQVAGVVVVAVLLVVAVVLGVVQPAGPVTTVVVLVPWPMAIPLSGPSTAPPNKAAAKTEAERVLGSLARS